MKKLIDDLYYNVVPINDGYLYLFTDDVFVPIYDTSLLITKRIVMPINLVEEKILQLLNLGITQIDEISQILGLNRRLLEVTLADLYSKNLISVSSNACTMLVAGKEALNKLNRTEKKQDILKNIYMDGVLGEIIDATNLELVDNLRNDDAKLHPVFQIGDLHLYNNCFEKISQIFMQENKMFYLEGVPPIEEELLKIDKVESTFVKFIKISIHVYVSNNGVDIDIIAKKNKMKDLLDTHKDYIISQINSKKIFKSYFKNKEMAQDGYEGEIFETSELTRTEIKKIHFNKNKIDYDLLKEQVLCNRKLLDGEFVYILKYICSQNEDLSLYVENLDEWAYNQTFTGPMQDVLGKSKLKIYYKKSSNPKRAIEIFKRSFNNVDKYELCEHKYYICWDVGNYILYGIPTINNVINDNTNCISIDYYLKLKK